MTIWRGSDESMSLDGTARPGADRWPAASVLFLELSSRNKKIRRRHGATRSGSMKARLLCLFALLGAANAFAPMPAARRAAVATPAASTVEMTKCSCGGDGDPKGEHRGCKETHMSASCSRGRRPCARRPSLPLSYLDIRQSDASRGTPCPVQAQSLCRLPALSSPGRVFRLAAKKNSSPAP
jgi:hypothetical protein